MQYYKPLLPSNPQGNKLIGQNSIPEAIIDKNFLVTKQLIDSRLSNFTIAYIAFTFYRRGPWRLTLRHRLEMASTMLSVKVFLEIVQEKGWRKSFPFCVWLKDFSWGSHCFDELQIMSHVWRFLLYCFFEFLISFFLMRFCIALSFLWLIIRILFDLLLPLLVDWFITDASLGLPDGESRFSPVQTHKKWKRIYVSNLLWN